MAWVLLVNLSTFFAWFLLVNLTKNAQNFRRFAPNRAGVFIFIENLQNFGRGFLIEGGLFLIPRYMYSLTLGSQICSFPSLSGSVIIRDYLYHAPFSMISSHSTIATLFADDGVFVCNE